jgi:PAS domain S-box-containing protein
MPIQNTSLLDKLQKGFFEGSEEHALILVDPEGTIVGWRGAAEQILGYTEEEVVGRPVAIFFTPEDSQRGLDRHEFEVARHDSRSEDDRWHVRKDGTRIWVTGSVMSVRGDAGEVIGFVKILRDRTDLKAYIGTLENDLADARASRQRTLDFIRTLGHEMRNPLSPLLNSAQILEKTSQEPRVLRVAEIIRNQVGALSRMAEDLMSVARLGTGQVELQVEPVDLRTLIDNVVVGLGADARARGVEMQAILPPTPLAVQIDRGRFQQVLLNLVGNAIKYTPRGGHVWCKATIEGEEVVLRVQDTGIGIRADVLPRIFELFSRERRAEELEPSGLGVGLAIANQVVRLHGGTLQARSNGEGKGAEFTVRLPFAP